MCVKLYNIFLKQFDIKVLLGVMKALANSVEMRTHFHCLIVSRYKQNAHFFQAKQLAAQ